jgi:hypothetical protein
MSCMDASFELGPSFFLVCENVCRDASPSAPFLNPSASVCQCVRQLLSKSGPQMLLV